MLSKETFEGSSFRQNAVLKVVPCHQGATFNTPPLSKVNVFLISFFIFLILPISFLSPALASVLPAPAPSGQSVLSAQTEKDTSGACYSGLGRSLLLSWSPAFNLELAQASGLGLYVVTRADRYGPLTINDFRLDLRKGLEPSLSDSSRLLFSNLSPSGSQVVEEYNDGVTLSQTSLLSFTFPTPLILKKPLPGTTYQDTYATAYLTCRVPPPASYQPVRYLLRETGSYRIGLSRLYDEIHQTYGASYSTALNLLLFSPASSLSSLSSSSNSVPPSSVLHSPSPHPLILIHGLSGKPEDWYLWRTNYQSYLRDLGYPDTYVHYYSYGYKNGVYNYQGDLREITLGLEAVVNRLSEQYKADGGDGRVDLLGYSLGGIVGRQYLASHPTNHRIRKLITIGSPHRGVWALGVDRNLYNLPVIGKDLEKQIASKILELVNAKKTLKISVDSPAAKQMIPNSDFLEGYNGINRHVPQDVEYSTLYGDIHALVKRQLFGHTLEKKMSIGDGLVMSDSATGIPSVHVNKLPYSEETVLSLKLSRLTDSYALEAELPNLSSLKAFHLNLLDREDLRRDLACGVLGIRKNEICN